MRTKIFVCIHKYLWMHTKNICTHTKNICMTSSEKAKLQYRSGGLNNNNIFVCIQQLFVIYYLFYIYIYSYLFIYLHMYISILFIYLYIYMALIILFMSFIIQMKFTKWVMFLGIFFAPNYISKIQSFSKLRN